MSRDRYFYIQAAVDGFRATSRLMKALQENRQEKAQPGQWLGWLRGLTQKGVKLSEMEDSGILDWLQSRAESDPNRRISKQEIMTELEIRIPVIKVVDLARPRFARYRSLEEGVYSERLYILSSESMRVEDRMEDVLYRVQELGFDPSPLLDDPLLVDRLEQEYDQLCALKPKAWDFSSHHFSAVIKDHGKNLLAHARTVLHQGNFFIQEIQSDWAQKGRVHNWSANFPRAPFVTSTEQWAGLVLNDLLQKAALDASVKQVTWTRADMRNGFSATVSDNLAEFYDNIVRRMVEKRLAKSGARVTSFPLVDKRGVSHEVLGFEMTSKVREILASPYPLYSRDHIVRRTPGWMDAAYESDIRARVARECIDMLGSAHMVRFFNRIYDIASGSEVAGRYIHDTIELSWRAQDPIRVARHEAMHFAYDHLLMAHERRVLDEACRPGSDLNLRTQVVLLSHGLKQAAQECRDSAQECAAYAFEYWARGELDVAPKPRGIFEKLGYVLCEIGAWIRKMVHPTEQQTPQEIFESLKCGVLAARKRVEQLHQDRCNEESMRSAEVG